MIFNTWTFGLFLILFLPAYWLILKPSWRPAGLLAAGLAFYAWFAPGYLPLIAAITVFTYFSGKLILRYRKERAASGFKNPVVLLWISVTACVLLLGYYKYLGMLADTLNGLLRAAGTNASIAVPQLLVPLGLSFFIFEFIHYLVDCYYGRTRGVSLLEFGVFAMFFPTLVSGPIKRFQPFIEQLRSKAEYSSDFLVPGARRILFGFAKKILIADIIGAFTGPLSNFSSGGDAGPAVLWLAAYAYAFKIYFDFSGYSDIAIGCARLFGFEVPENFNRPYLRQNIAEFWRCWHMSLTSWLKDYIYMPIGKKLMPVMGRRHPLLLAAICQMVTMGVSGLWHGASWSFLVWGLYHGAGMTVHRIFLDINTRIKRGRSTPETRELHTDKRAPAITALPAFLKKAAFTFLTFQFVTIGWVFFVLDIRSALKVIGRMLLLW